MKAAEKREVMAAFRAGEIEVLVATVVVEVGVDVPNASAIVIEGAERFGLSQLHQLRGRVCRGLHPPKCFLIGEPKTDIGRSRLEALCEHQDGFKLSEVDLAIRGEGTLFGSRQSGMPDLKVAKLLRDVDVLVEARKEAFDLVARDPTLKNRLTGPCGGRSGSCSARTSNGCSGNKNARRSRLRPRKEGSARCRPASGRPRTGSGRACSTLWASSSTVARSWTCTPGRELWV